MKITRQGLSACIAMMLFLPNVAAATDAYLLYSDKNVFHGCLNCSRFDDTAVCNEFGDYGSAFGSDSIWNQYGDAGSKYGDDSPWNRYSEGLKVVDREGNYFGRLSKNKYATDRLAALDQWFDLHERLEGDLKTLRKLVCGK